jgi:hypothetical protein
MDRSQPKGLKPAMIGRKLISGVNWRGALKQKSVKQGRGIYRSCLMCYVGAELRE